MMTTTEMITFTEKLLEEIKKFPVLYDRKFMRCKDGGTEKEEAWELLTKRLPEDLNITVAETKRRWRTLKDCYAKFLRSATSSNRFEVRYKSWRWSSHMDYFKAHMIHDDETTSPKPRKKERCNDRRTNAYKMKMLNKRLKRELDGDDTDIEEHSKSQNGHNDKLAKKRLKAAEEENASNDMDNDPYEAITYALSDYEDTGRSEPETTETPINMLNPKLTSSVENDNFKDPLMGGNFDALDLTFLGYASSIKKLSPRRQTIVKFTVAKLIMQQELAEQNEKDHKEHKEHTHKTTSIRTAIERL